MTYGLKYLILSLFLASNALALDSLSYSGRLVNADGSPVTGTPDIQFNLSYTNAPATIICTKTITNVPLTKGVFHTKLDYIAADCTGSQTLAQVLALVPAGETIALQVTDLTNSKAYTYQAIHSIPSSIMSNIAKTLTQMGATPGQVLTWDGSKWAPSAVTGATGGTVTSVATGTGLTGGTITASGTISIAAGGVGTTELANSGVTDAKIASGITRTKLLNGTPNYVLMNNGSGVISEVAQVAIAQGGTGASTVAGVWTNLGIGSSAAYDYSACMPGQVSKFILPGGWTCIADSDSLDNTKLPLDGSGAMTGALNMNSNKIESLANPTLPGDAANMAYVDAQVSGLNASQWINSTPNIYFNTGNVGIGMTGPAFPLNISSNSEGARIQSTSNSAHRMRIFSGEGGNYLIGDYDSQNVLNLSYDSNVGGSLKFEYGTRNASINDTNYPAQMKFSPRGSSVTSLFLDATGKVAIGHSAPLEKLDIAGNIALTGNVRFKSDNANFVELKAPAALASTLIFNLPGTAGASGNALVTDGSGNLSWAAVATGSSSVGGDLSGTITSATIVTGAVTSNKISDGTIVDADISATAAIAQSKISGLSTSLFGKEPTITAGTTLQYWRGDKTWQTLNSAAVPELTNLYFTEARVLGTDLAGYSAGAGTVTATDTVLSAIEKLGGNQGNYVLKAGDTMSGALAMGSNSITGLPLPGAGDHATNKTYVDGLVSGSSHWTKVVNDINYTAGNVGIGTTTIGTSRTKIFSNGLTNDKVLEVTGSGIAGGQAGPFYGIFVNAPANNSSTARYGIYADGNGGGSGSNYGVYGTTSMFSSTRLAVGVQGHVLANSAATNNSPNSPTPVAGVLATANVTGTSMTAVTTALLARNESAYGLTSYGAYIDAVAGPTTVVPLRVDYNTSEIMRVTSSGNVGIGTATPTYPLSIYRTTGTVTSNIESGANGSAAQTRFAGLTNGGAARVWGAGLNISAGNGEYVIYDYTAGAERVFINTSGNMGIGTTAPSEKLDVAGNIALTGRLRLKSDTANFVELKAPASLASTLTLNLPGTAGTAGNALTTDGAGNLSWSAVATTSSAVGGDLTGTISNAQIVAGSIVDADVAAGAAIAQSKIANLTTDLAAKEPTITAGATTQYWRGDKTWQTLNTNVVPEPAGATNLYFLDSRVRAALMSGYTIGSALSISPTDTLVEAIGKLEGSIASLQSSGQWTASGGNVYRSSGHVGIGTSSPENIDAWSRVLDVYAAGHSKITSSTANVNMSINAHDAGYYGAPAGGLVGTRSNHPVSIYTNYISRMTVSAAGDVGIGTSSPGKKLHVAGPNTDAALLLTTPTSMGTDGVDFTAIDFAYAGSANSKIARIAANVVGGGGGNLNFQTPTTGVADPYTTKMTILREGNVGIGVIAPATRLHVEAAGPDIAKFRSPNDGGNEMVFGYEDATNALYMNSNFSGGSDRFEFRAANVALMSMLANGRVGIGTTTPGAKLEIKAGAEGQTAPVEALRIWGPNTPGDSNSAQDIKFAFSAAGSTRIRSYRGTSWQTYLQFMTNPNVVGDNPLVRMHIHDDGNVGIGNINPSEKLEVTGNILATSFLYTSDARLKKDVKKIAKALLNLEKMRGVHFTWNETNKKEMGFIAQEIEKIHPELVVTNKKTGMKSVKYGNMVALLMEAIKELKTEKDLEVKNLKREVASLKELVCMDHPNAKICKK